MHYSDYLIVFYWLLLASVTLRVIMRRRNISASLAWLLVIYIVPLLGAIAYLLFGELQLGHRRAKLAQSMRVPYLQSLTTQLSKHAGPVPQDGPAQAIYQLLHHSAGVSSLGYNELTILHNPDEIFTQLLADIADAKSHICMEFYIWYSAGRVKDVEAALIAAAERGVKIQLLIDHAGSWKFFLSPSCRQLRRAGIEILQALPVSLWRLPFRRADIRLHRKLVVIDHQLALTGSMNMADPEVFNMHANVGKWIDIMIRIKGAAAVGLAKVFAWDWEVETGDRRLPKLTKPLPPSEEYLAVIPSGPGIGFDLISRIMLSLIHRANHEIIIATPYFVPSDSIFDALCHAARRGVKVTILVPKRNDSWLVSWASRAFYDELLQAGGHIHLFKGGLLHVKALVVDQSLALVGTVNLDVRSLQLNFEMSLALFNQASCKALLALLDDYLADSDVIDPDEWHQRSSFAQLRERLVLFLSPLL